MYNYLFYTFYRMFGTGKTSRATNEQNASLYIVILEALLFASVLNYKKIITGEDDNSSTVIVEIGSFFIAAFVINWLVFLRKARFEKIVEKFNQWPKEKNTRGAIIVAIISVLIIANLVVSINLQKT